MLIYIATNRVNGKQYVGQTTLTLERRKRTHIWKSLVGGCSGYFYNAIRKYGQKNFVWKILHDNINSINYLNKL
ncbi:GIY-YIG nuclease family protein, partial [Candidatus Parcubacteria bacterium]|nr:GIY-YIG nuclease family protein [Candidatus Parcubacteria bacterium]